MLSKKVVGNEGGKLLKLLLTVQASLTALPDIRNNEQFADLRFDPDGKIKIINDIELNIK